MASTCRNGHPSTRQNCYISLSGKIACRPCRRAQAHRWVHAHRAELRASRFGIWRLWRKQPLTF
jgi:hypothetical protein